MIIAWLLGGILILLLFHHRSQIREFFAFQKKIRECSAAIGAYPGIPILGNCLEFANSDRTIFTLARMSQEMKTGTFSIWLGPIMKVIVTDPRDYEIIMSSPKAAEKDSVYKFMEPAVINGLINGGGPVYRSHKKLVVPLINGGNSITGHIKQFNIQTKKLVDGLEKHVGGEEFDVHHNIVPCVADIVFETIFGVAGNAQDGHDNIMVEVTEALLHVLYKRIMNIWLWPDVIFQRTPMGKWFLHTIINVHTFLNTIIDRKRQEIKKLQQDGEAQVDLSERPVLDQIMAHSMKTNAWTDQDFRSEMFTLFIGSHDTIAGVSCFVTLVVAMFPDIQQKVREEVQELVGNRDITEEDTINMKYLDAVIRETIRIFPVGPILARQMTGDLKLATCTLPKGACVFLLPYATHRDSRHWKDPTKFMPERFLGDNIKDRHTWAFVPFSGGIRSCPGSKYGMICIKIIMSQMLRTYQLSTTTNFETMDVHAHISTRCPNGYPISIKKL